MDDNSTKYLHEIVFLIIKNTISKNRKKLNFLRVLDLENNRFITELRNYCDLFFPERDAKYQQLIGIIENQYIES